MSQTFLLSNSINPRKHYFKLTQRTARLTLSSLYATLILSTSKLPPLRHTSISVSHAAKLQLLRNCMNSLYVIFHLPLYPNRLPTTAFHPTRIHHALLPTILPYSKRDRLQSNTPTPQHHCAPLQHSAPTVTNTSSPSFSPHNTHTHHPPNPPAASIIHLLTFPPAPLHRHSCHSNSSSHHIALLYTSHVPPAEGLVRVRTHESRQRFDATPFNLQHCDNYWK
eukprot:GFKZ01006495.1.p1 GENE.GFKZ01006495.1~~GFKZ01006495.1.p1  ORF type:complete len:223 (-),score=3.52 GFKZ01006495.1:1031-1699(-)